MGLFSALLDDVRHGIRAGGDANDERYWLPDYPHLLSATGIRVTPALALQVSCMFQGTRLIAETLGSLPLIVYRESENGAKQRARDHRLWTTLRKQANPWQTAQQWRETMTAHAILWGNGFSEIVAEDDLRPLDPDRVQVEQLDSGRLRFQLHEPDGTHRTLVHEQVFRLQGIAIHRFMGASLLHLAREAIGLWLAMEKFSALYFAQGAKPGVWLEHPGKLADPARDRLREQKQQMIGGLANMHRLYVAEDGMKVKEVGFSARDSQLTEAMQAHVLECARWLNIPEHMFRAGKQPTFASAEQFFREFVDITLRPWAVRWESCIARDLVAEDDVYAEHLFEGLLRGNTIDRANAMSIFVMNGIMTRNEARLRENLDPLPGLDEPLTPLNLERTGANKPGQAPAEPGPRRVPPPPDEDDEDDEAASAPRRLRLIAKSTARRLVRKETTALKDKAIKLASKPGAWIAWVGEFYGAHAVAVADALQLEPLVAAAYCERHMAAVLTDITLIDRWEAAAVEELTALVLEEIVDA